MEEVGKQSRDDCGLIKPSAIRDSLSDAHESTFILEIEHMRQGVLNIRIGFLARLY
jgi:hypothetical protein